MEAGEGAQVVREEMACSCLMIFEEGPFQESLTEQGPAEVEAHREGMHSQETVGKVEGD